MNNDQMKQWIDSASYQQLLQKVRYAPLGSPWFQGEIGAYFGNAIGKARASISPADAVAASKAIGWDQ